MPKRARCPYCDRLFSREDLDDHVRQCRTKYDSRQVDRSAEKKVMVIDGSNVAFYMTRDGTPRLENIIMASHSIASAGLIPITVVSAALVHQIDKDEQLAKMIATKRVIQAPGGIDDDLEIIKTAEKKNADIVSNDRFLDWLDKYPWLPSRLRKYRMSPSGLILV
jgi:hypothetical protein